MIEYLRTREVAVKFGVHIATVRRWHREGHLTGLRLPSGHMRYHIDEVRALEKKGAPEA